MPVYQYQCRNCGATLEKMQSFSADPLVECPACHRPALKRVLQPAGIIFKGSGWYVTDSKKSSAATTASSSSSNGEKPESKSAESTTTESKLAETKTAAPSASATSNS